MATDKPLVSVYMPPEVLERLREYQTEKGLKSASAAVVEALMQFFHIGTHASLYAPLDRLVALEGKVDRLTQQVAALSQALAQQQPITLAKTAPRTEQYQTKLTKSATIEAAEVYGYEDFEDEPDEILYGFLEPE